MTKSDQEIGEVVAVLRGAVPQRDIAERMTNRGFKWTQGTVSSVEKGERSLKLTEGAVLAEILGTDVQSLIADEEAARLERDFRAGQTALTDARQEIQRATRKFIAAQGYLRRIRSSLSEDELALLDGDLRADPVEIAAREKERSQDAILGSDQMINDGMAEYITVPPRLGRRLRPKSLEGTPERRLL
ncbi:hypothetical protein BJF77_11010 [Kocuria sp. CNJ-770]|uniref:helix-turn-helix domain-containing protein n=1 Tax=Kocuria sp. CNJ-770 TaxID=1904964 RepID=UPI000967AA9E|nr:hypothetical protein [Kocuria sp. CNJ-770]OLT09309.1 hypothetical protein BJF77_11010 [Kocuria sp. CNJ-770]